MRRRYCAALPGCGGSAPSTRATFGRSRSVSAPTCPFALDSRAAYVAGIGEVLAAPPPLPPCGVLLVNPGVPVATGPVFAARRGPFSAADCFCESPADAAALAALLRTRRNDLEPPARALVPEINRVLARVAAAPGCLLARMTGSGGTCFGLFADEAAASDAAGAVTRDHPGWWVHPTHLVHEGGKADEAATLGRT